MNTDREKLINWIRNIYVSNPPYTYKATADDTADAVIADMLIANDVVVREKGEWEDSDDGDGAVCSVCREDFCVLIYETERFNFCPSCGADMREKN